MKKCTLIVTLLLFNMVLFSQENLVPNPAFQDVIKKVKVEGQIELATPWISPTLAPADLYVSNTKNELVGVPDNGYGEEKPMEGDNYVGILAYSYKNKEPRSYLQAKLTSKLEAGKEYCVTINVSLADLSKYSCNYVGAYLSKNAVSANNSDVLEFEPQIVSSRLTVYETQFYWTPICGKFKADGDEEYITIGNFTPDLKLTTKKVKRPRGFTSPQTYDAYYYVDNISVKEVGESDKCDCDAIPGMEDAEMVSRNFGSNETDAVKGTTKIINTDGSSVESSSSSPVAGIKENTSQVIISFDPKSFSIIGDASAKLDQLVALLKETPTLKIAVSGFYDASEKEIEKLDAKRVMTVYKYLVSKGVNKEIIKRSMEGMNNPNKDVLQNMKAVIDILKPEE